MNYFNFPRTYRSTRTYFQKYVFLLLLTAFFINGLSSCGKKKKEVKSKGPSGPAIVDIIIAGSRNISSDIEVNGTVLANEFVQLMPEVSGRLTYLHIPEGKFVKKGTILARINDADLQAQIQKIKVQLELAVLTEQRLKKLITINGVNQSEYDLALNQVNSLKADLAYTQTLAEKTILKAPFSGRVGLRNISEGAMVSPSTVVTTLQETNRLKLDFTLPEEFGDLIAPGKSVNVMLDQNKGSLQKATVIAAEPQINVTTRNILARAILPPSSATPGSFAKVYIKTGNSAMHIVVPTNCIIPEAKTKKIVVIKNGKAEMVSVETGARREGLAEVTKGISEGDSVVVAGVLFTKPGAEVKVRSVKPLDEFAN